jgi:hypothetical protein
MKDEWYSDNRDLIKWGGIVHLCKETNIKYVMQVAYYRETSWPQLNFNSSKVMIPEEVLSHFRDINEIKRLGEKIGLRINVEDRNFSRDDRNVYTNSICELISKQKLRQVVFLDPDTGIAISNVKAAHVTPQELLLIWQSMKRSDFLVLYQHSCRDTSWKTKRRKQLADACKVSRNEIKQWEAKELAHDVVLFYCEKK